MILKEIEYGTTEHQAMIDLRNKILREPLGLVFTEKDLKREEKDYLIGCYNESKLIGCCVLSPIDKNTIQLRQMAVDSNIQQKGIGCRVLAFAEKLSSERGFKEIYLHARKIAVRFYEKYNYNIKGKEFIEVGIPHYEMKKQIDYLKTFESKEK